jgi:predicted HTH transcriptional regulator
VNGNYNENDSLLSAIAQRVETRSVEYKESQEFGAIKWMLPKTVMAMANLRDGGCIIIGIGERNGTAELTGIDPAHERTYNQDDLIALVNRYARPPVTLTMRVVECESRRFIGVLVQPFERIPIICGNPMPQEAGRHALKLGEIPARTKDRVSTSKVGDADLVAEILEIAAEKRAAEIISTAQRLGLRMPERDRERFDRERAAFEEGQA